MCRARPNDEVARFSRRFEAELPSASGGGSTLGDPAAGRARLATSAFASALRARALTYYSAVEFE